MTTARYFPASLPLGQLLHFTEADPQEAVLFINELPRSGRMDVVLANAALPGILPWPRRGLWGRAAPTGETGDRAPVCTSHTCYHPLYLAALLTATHWRPAYFTAANLQRALAHLPIAAVTFDTDLDIRRSMTLNAMRMTTEFMENGSSRVLDLAENCLDQGQTDVVHDALVYIMRQILEVRRTMWEATVLRVENVAAYLGLEQRQVLELLRPGAAIGPCATRIGTAIEAGRAGAPKRALAALPLVRSQATHLLRELRPLRHCEKSLLALLDAVAGALDATG